MTKPTKFAVAESPMVGLPALAKSTCVECACYKAAGGGQGNCRRQPPRAFMFLLPPAIQGGGPQNYNVSGWPVVNDGDWCIDGFKTREGIVQ